MNRRTILSVAIILLAVASVGGATMAWFTDSEELTNSFTAGSLSISADDEWKVSTYEQDDSDVWDNANPGECQLKEFEITNTGSKKVYLRFNYSGGWTVMPNGDLNNAVDSLVTISPVDMTGWTFLEIGTDGGYWYYNGFIPTEGDDAKLKFAFNVCLDGPDTGNEYQGATYEIDFTFEAVQATHYASFNLWNAGYYNNDAWYEVAEAGDDFVLVDGPNTTPWVPTGPGEPNYEGWTY